MDADPEMKSLLTRILEPRLWAIHHAPNNATALDRIQTKAFDLVLTGEKTSGREDLELLAKIRRARPHTRLIILTMDGTPADVVTAMRKHAFSYFSKPFSEEHWHE